MSAKSPRTLGEFLNFDVDAFLRDGGQLLNLKLPGAEIEPLLRAMPPDMFPAGFAERTARMGRFVERLGKLGPADKKVGNQFTEAQLRKIWDSDAQWSDGGADHAH